MATIFMMDDEASTRAILWTVLELAEHAVLGASTGREGLTLYRHTPTDLVIAHIFMPKLNGLDTMMELTREFLNVTVIAISDVVRLQKTLETARRAQVSSFGIREEDVRIRKRPSKKVRPA